MNHAISRISLDIHDMTSQCSISVKQGDTIRRLVITLTDNGKIYDIPSYCYAVFSAKKSDGKFVGNGCVIQDNKIIFDFVEQLTTAVGRMDCDITLYGMNSEQITSSLFTIYVFETIRDEYEGAVQSSDEFTILSDLITTANVAINDARTATLDAQDAASEAQENLERLSQTVPEVEAIVEDARQTTEEAKNTVDTIKADATTVLSNLTKDADATIDNLEQEADAIIDNLEQENAALVEQVNHGLAEGKMSGFIRFSEFPDGTNLTEDWHIGQKYMGTYIGLTDSGAPTDPKWYKWSEFNPFTENANGMLTLDNGRTAATIGGNWYGYEHEIGFVELVDSGMKVIDASSIKPGLYICEVIGQNQSSSYYAPIVVMSLRAYSTFSPVFSLVTEYDVLNDVPTKTKNVFLRHVFDRDFVSQGFDLWDENCKVTTIPFWVRFQRIA